MILGFMGANTFARKLTLSGSVPPPPLSIGVYSKREKLLLKSKFFLFRVDQFSEEAGLK